MEVYRKSIKAAVLSLCIFSAACTAQFRNHGYVPSEDELSEIIVGVDTRDTVAETIGTPTAGGVLEEGGYYYVRSQVKTLGPFRPEEVDRQLVAVTFDNRGVVANIERFGLEDGRVVRLSRRVTDNGFANVSLLRQLLGNIGNFDAGSLLQ